MHMSIFIDIPTTDPIDLSSQISSGSTLTTITAMVDLPTAVCCLCGDIGFSDKLFHCSRCQSRFQHSYCTSFYGEEAAGLCDWCLSEVGRSLYGHQKLSKSIGRKEIGRGVQLVEGSVGVESRQRRRKGMRPAGRRYKLLKDIMC